MNLIDKRADQVQVGELMYSGDGCHRPILKIHRVCEDLLEISFHDQWYNVGSVPHFNNETISLVELSNEEEVHELISNALYDANCMAGAIHYMRQLFKVLLVGEYASLIKQEVEA